MASFTTGMYKKKRKIRNITLHCEVNDRVVIPFMMPGQSRPQDFYGTVIQVTRTRCQVEFDDKEKWWVNRYGKEAEIDSSGVQ